MWLPTRAFRLALSCSLFASAAPVAADEWIEVLSDGAVDDDRSRCDALAVFGDHLYAASGQVMPDIGDVA